MRTLLLDEMASVSGGQKPTGKLEDRVNELEGDDSGNRYYDSTLGQGTVTNGGATWVDSNNNTHVTGWFANLPQNQLSYIAANEQVWTSQDACLADARSQQVEHLVGATLEGASAGAGYGGSAAGLPGAFLGAITGAGVGLAGGALTAPAPSEMCPP